MSESISKTGFREALAHFASGVTVVTARDGPSHVGFTVTAFASVSLAPPLILVCVGKTASAHDAIMAAELFGVSILGERQAWIAERFAQSGIDRFSGVALREDATRAPLIEGALVHLECRRQAAHDAGDHVILLGHVLDASIGTGRPLLHFARSFGRFAPDGGARAPAPNDEQS